MSVPGGIPMEWNFHGYSTFGIAVGCDCRVAPSLKHRPEPVTVMPIQPAGLREGQVWVMTAMGRSLTTDLHYLHRLVGSKR